MAPRDPGQIATVLVALAVTEFSPSQIRAGKETSVPPPATELMDPAAKAAAKAIKTCVIWAEFMQKTPKKRAA
jgi:hypothetical protein